MVNRGDGKKSDTYGPPGSQHHVNQGLKQQQQQPTAAVLERTAFTWWGRRLQKAANDPHLFPYPLKRGVVGRGDDEKPPMVHLVNETT